MNTLKHTVLAVGALILMSSPALASINTHETAIGAPAVKLHNSISAKADVKSSATTDVAKLMIRER